MRINKKDDSVQGGIKMGVEKRFAIRNIDNIRVYIVDCDKTPVIVDRNTDIGMFADEAERQGTVVTLPYFIKILNDYDDTKSDGTIINFKNSFIRMAVVNDGVIVGEIEEV